MQMSGILFLVTRCSTRLFLTEFLFTGFSAALSQKKTMHEFLARLYQFEIRIRKAVNSQMRGNFRSIFKGSGLEFSDLRTYQYGDDVRAIDWNVSSKGHGTFVKIFREEKDQTVFFLIDVSASQEIGTTTRSKLDTTREVCGVLALSAIKEASHVGMYCFSDQKEKYLKPSNSMKHGYQLIVNLFKLKPESVRTSLTDALLFTLNVLKRRSVVFLVSDFIDSGYEHSLKALARKHDLVVIHMYDQRGNQSAPAGHHPGLRYGKPPNGLGQHLLFGLPKRHQADLPAESATVGAVL